MVGLLAKYCLFKTEVETVRLAKVLPFSSELLISSKKYWNFFPSMASLLFKLNNKNNIQNAKWINKRKRVKKPDMLLGSYVMVVVIFYNSEVRLGSE